VEFLRKCAKQYASNISDSELDIYVKNFELHHVAGSTILNFSDDQWNALTPSFGFRDFIRLQLQAKEKISQQEMRTALWNSSRKKASEEPSKPTLKDERAKASMWDQYLRNVLCHNKSTCCARCKVWF
jgi:hypothetical protein